MGGTWKEEWEGRGGKKWGGAWKEKVGGAWKEWEKNYAPDTYQLMLIPRLNKRPVYAGLVP